MPPRSKLGEIPRQDMPTRSAEERRMDFKEVPLGYTEEQALKEALRCLDCKVPHCMEGCPAKVKIPEFIGLVADGKFLEAAKKIKETNALPAHAEEFVLKKLNAKRDALSVKNSSL